MKKNYTWLSGIGNANTNNNKSKLHTYLKLGSKLIVSLWLVLGFTNLQAQTFNAPTLEWQKSYWPTTHPVWGTQTRENSGEDWFYSVTKSKENSVQNGYMCAGYNTYVNSIVTDGGGCLRYDPQDYPVECWEFETETYRKSYGIQQISFVDLDGNRKWHKNYLQGDFTKIIPCSDGNYLAIGNTRSTFNLAYNPSNNSNNQFNCTTVSNINKINVTKIDKDGVVIWSYLYGMEDYVGDGTSAFNLRTDGYNILEHEGSYYFTGQAIDPTNIYKCIVFIAEISTTGQLIRKQIVSPTGYDCRTPTLTTIGTGTNTQFLVAFEKYVTINTGDATAALYSLDNNFNTNWSNTYFTNPDAIRIWDITINNAGEIFLPIVINSFRGNFHGDGILKVCRIDPSNGAVIGIPTDLGNVTAYDLRPGITATTDGGFALVSSKKDYSKYIPSYPTDHNIICSYGGWNVFWRTDAYIVKCNAAGTVEWEKTFDANTPKQTGDMEHDWIYPNLNYDVKTSECMYSIVQNDDGSYTIAGNNSTNFDDDYLVKVYNDCDSRQSYTIQNSSNIIDINTNTTWSSSAKVIGTVVVKSGNTLTISGTSTEIEFADTRKTNIRTAIIVEKGAQLIINDAKLTSMKNCPDSKWDGILVEGQPTRDQMPISEQGYVKLTNATIENAITGISTSSNIYNDGVYTTTWNKTGGGIIIASNSSFINNNRHIEFMQYKRKPINGIENNNLSNFANCSFQIDGSKNIALSTYNNKGTMVTAWGVKGVRFLACEFKNNNGALNADLPNIDRGTGIYTLDASLVVDGSINTSNCAVTTWGTFNDLSAGIINKWSTGATLMSTYRYLDFKKTDRSIWLASGNTATIHNSKFDLNLPANYYNVANGTNSNAFNTGVVGIFANEMGAYVIESNTFTDASKKNKIIVGSILHNSDAQPTGAKVRLNKYEGVALGSQTQFNNFGLALTCNEYTDIVSSAVNMNPFSTTSNTPFFGECDPNSALVRKDYKNQFISNSNYDIYNYIKDINNNPVIKTYVVEPSGANTPATAKVRYVTVDMCQGLNVTEKEPCTATPGLSCTNIVINPDDAKTKLSLGKTQIINLNNAINSGNLTDVGMQQALAEKSHYEREVLQARGEVLWAYNKLGEIDSTVNSTDSIIAFLVAENDAASKRLLVATYYLAGQYEAAKNTLSELSTDGSDEMDNFIAYYTLLTNANIDGRNIFMLTADEWATMEQIAASNSSAAESAKGILTLVKGNYYDVYIERAANTGGIGKAGKITATAPENAKQNTNNALTVYPNPAQNSIFVKCNLNSITENTTVSLLDITGKIILTKKVNLTNEVLEIETQTLKDGFYFVQLNNITLETKKIIITH